MIFYEKLKDGSIGRSTESEKIAKLLSLTLKTNKDIVYSYDGKRYLFDECPEKPQSIINQERIDELKKFLAAADYWGQKYIDGEYTQEEWEEKKAQRKAWREEIRSLENSADSDG